jgi:glycosyltransferase involved in cell wall biosynthesis
MRTAGWESLSFATSISSINQKADWDYSARSAHICGFRIPGFEMLSCIYLFTKAVWNSKIIFMSADGFMLSPFNLYKIEYFLLRLAGCKIVIITYGSDAYVYRRMSTPASIHSLLTHYPEAARKQDRLAKRLGFWTSRVDCFIPSTMGPDGMGRWDVPIINLGFLDLDLWHPSSRKKGPNDLFTVSHSPNHRGVKGTEFLISAVEQLQQEGYSIELKLLEGLSNNEVRQILQKDVDLHVEAIIGPGHGLSALEGMSAGIPCISNLDHFDHFITFRRWSFFSECPLISASPETIKDVLLKLLTNDELVDQLGRLSREYMVKYYGVDSAVFLFSRILEYVNGSRTSLIDLYHPLLGEHPGLKEPLVVPLKLNQIIH